MTTMFSSPTAIRVLKKQDPALLRQHDLSSLRLLFLAGEPLDEPTARWIADAIGKPMIDNYWQTETGWPILAICRGVEALPSKFGSPGVPGLRLQRQALQRSERRRDHRPHEKGVVAIEGPLPPGCMTTVWGDDARFVQTYWTSVPNQQVYSTFDWGIRDEDGYYFILGRTDDVINVAGHRLGTREIEESLSSHPNVAEVAVVGVADAFKGQVAVAFAILKDAGRCRHAGRDARARRRHDEGRRPASSAPSRDRRAFTSSALLPKTRSGKLLRRSIQAICEGRDPGDLTTIEDPSRWTRSRGVRSAHEATPSAGAPGSVARGRGAAGRPRRVVELRIAGTAAAADVARLC